MSYSTRSSGNKRSGVPVILLGPLCFALALLSAEAGIAIGAYLLSYTLFLEQGSIRKRLIHLIPYALVFLPWAVTYVLLDCGARNAPLYTDPLNEPLLYLKAIFLRAPVYLLGQWTLPIEFNLINWPSIIHRAGLIFSALLILILIPLIRKDRTAQFWTLGMFLSLLPICAVIPVPADRNLLFVGLGAMGLLAQWIYWMIHTGWNVTFTSFAGCHTHYVNHLHPHSCVTTSNPSSKIIQGIYRNG